MSLDKFFLIWGFAAQGIFAARFIVQWIASEREKRSVIPMAFWYLSLTGGLMLFIYALYRKDPVFILGQASGLIVYIRNIVFRLREKKQLEQAGEKQE
ncbi:lipid A biosynthesis domain-containing protein [Thermotomaculum hydrothermale]|uniref:Lipid A biosynthesis domain-containing protein n=1 Tax=Thermotomaculum hydrothermale TaxID=981385 RepID=A0A7R6SXY3_9BACT|nr:lipid-A-disaccharide synthase N-terminal domain-containing protein [Thermotomaculum hydrothermale]BBB31996.1 lipid A biosynthesis domain-containing protein [Thermotomaculum hydrothermale]